MISTNLFRSAGSLGLLAAGAATLLVLSQHPHIHAGSTEQLLRMAADARLGTAAAHVHGALIAILGLALYGVVELAAALGLRRAPVASGLAVYALGAAAMCTAMLLDGFATAQTAALLVAQGAADGAASVFALLSVTIQVFTKAGFAAMGIGMACLSLCGTDRARGAGLVGTLVALVPAGFAVFGGAWLRQHQLMVLAGCQAAWYLGAAVFLAARRGGPTAPNRRSRP